MSNQYYMETFHAIRLYDGERLESYLCWKGMYLIKRVREHKYKIYPNSFTAKYNVTKLVWYIEVPDYREAIVYEKFLKGLLRAKKIALVEEINPKWEDLSRYLEPR